MADSASSTLAPGFRFHPTDEELLIYYLKRKLLNRPLLIDAISSVNLYQLEPWDLPQLAKLQTKDQEWFFFCPLDRKNNCNQPRTNRATPRGYWKTTGKDREIVRRDDLKTVVGMKKTLVYHSGRAPRGKRTKWVMHEYRLLDEKLANDGVPLDGLVVCRIFEKKAAGHQIGVQYGAPVAEEESEEEREELEKDKDEVQVHKGKIGNENCAQFVDPNLNISENENNEIMVAAQQNVANIPEIQQEPDIFNGLDEIFNHDNTFFEMNDLSTGLNSNLPNYPSPLNGEELLVNPDSFFDSLDEFNQTDNFFSNQNVGDEFSMFFDAVGSNSIGNSSGLDEILHNSEGVNNDFNYSGIDGTGNVENYNTQDIVPNSVPYSPLSERLISLLDSYSPPPAFASELKNSKLNFTTNSTTSASSASLRKSKGTKVNSVASKVLRGVVCVAIVLTAGCKLAICIGG